MSDSADGHCEGIEAPHLAERSLGARGRAKKENRHTYFNTTQGMLRGSPSHADMDEILKVLDESGIVYLYEPESNRPRPTFYARGIISIGLAEISRAAARLSAAS